MAERAVLGGMMLEESVLWEVLGAVRAGDFSDPALAKVFEAIGELAHAGDPVDVISVTDRLQRTGRMDARVTPALPHELTSETPTGANAPYYAGIVADLAKRRRMAAAGQQLIDMAGGEGDVEGMVERARGVVDEVSAATVSQVAPIGARLDSFIEELDEKPRMSPTPWPALDRLIGGFRPGALYVIAGRPGKGKSAIAGQIAYELAKQGTTGFVTVEMGEEEVLQRIVSAVGSVPFSAITNHQMTHPEWRAFAVAEPMIRALPLYVADRIRVFTQVASFARTLHRKGDLQGLVIDYLGLMTSGEKHTDRRLDLEAVTRGAKVLAKQLDIPVFLLAQLNRAAVVRGKGKEVAPIITDLRDTGSLEQDADCVILLHRDEQRNRVLEMNVAKHRQGPTGRIELKWEGGYMRASEKDWGATALLDEGEVA